MRLSEIAPIILEIIKSQHEINAKEIAIISGFAIRRVYDITTVLESLDLINTSYPTNFTRKYKIFSWKGDRDVEGKIKFNTNRLKISCINGSIVRVINSPSSIMVEGSHNLSVENHKDFHS